MKDHANLGVEAFTPILGREEKLLWSGRPDLIPFLASGLPYLATGLAWGAFYYLVFMRRAESVDLQSLLTMLMFTMPTWASLFNMGKLAVTHHNTRYGLTDRRVLLRSGFIGIDFKSIDHDKIQDLEVRVSPIERMFGVGTIEAYSGRMVQNAEGGPTKATDKLIAIRDPYAVFTRIKTVSLDVKSDLNYPNAIRPDVNPGYRSAYRPPV